MSAKEHYRPPAIVLPDLPPEIWLSIFRLATWSTNIFNPKLMVSTGCDTSYREQLREFKRSLITKRYLVRVCKAWYYLASPLLFEYIFLGRGRVLAPLRDGMLRSEQAVELQESPHTIGWRTQRLDVHIRDRTDNRALIMDILTDILRRLPNLRILTFAVIGHGYDAYYDYYLPESVLEATNACRDTLQILNWYGGLKPPPNAWASFLENHPRLEAINVPVALTQLENSHIVLNSLKSVYVYCYTNPLTEPDIENELWNIDLPNIRHAIYDITPIFPGLEIASQDFLPKIGPKLTSIQINCFKAYSADPSLFFAFYNTFLNMAVNCKNLTRVDIVTSEWQIPTPGDFPKTVHTLGIRVNAHLIPKRFMDPFFGSTIHVLSDFSSLRTICFMDQANVRALRAHPRVLRANLIRILELDVNAIDHEGQPLYDSLR